MREIIQLQIGHCGSAIGCKFWEVIITEHGLDWSGNWKGDSELQRQRLNVFFTEVDGEKFVPRTIFIDLDPSASPTNSIPLGRLFRPDNIIYGKNGAANNWAKGYRGEGATLVDVAMEIIRREAEACDLMQGLQIAHALGGGTGSGLTSLLMQKLHEDYPRRILANFSILPSSNTSEIVVEPYNATLTFPSLIQSADNVFLIDNAALHNTCTRTLEMVKPSYGDMNHLVSLCMSGITACLRFPGQLNADLRKLHVNMVPFPKLHFFIPGYAPLMSKINAPFRSTTVGELTRELFDVKRMFVNCDPSAGRFLTVAAIFRGRMSTKEVDEQMSAIQNKNSRYFVQWIPHCIKTAICDIPPRGLKLAATTISNTTAIQEPLQRFFQVFQKLFNRKAYLHWYTEEGMDEMEFTEAQNSMENLISEYRECEEMKVE